MRGRIDIGLVIESLLAAAVAIALGYGLWFLANQHYLPQPFFYDYGDTWMDWFNPAYWSHQPGTYDAYKTIYPPLTFAILKFITWGPCYVGAEGGWSRDCDMLGIFSLHAIYVINVVLTAATLMKIDRRTALPRSIAVAMGLPMMWGLDRGNTVLLAYTFILLAYGPLIHSARWRWVCAGMAVNLKVYLIGTIFAQLIHRRWRWFEGALVATVGVYLVSYVILGEGGPKVIYENITLYAGDFEINNPLDLWMASSLKPLTALLESTKFPASMYVGSQIADIGLAILPWVTRCAQAIIMLGAAVTMLRPGVVPRSRMIVLSIGIAILSTEVSGYAQIMVLLFTFMERFEGILRRYAIIIAYVICIPADIPIDRLPPLVAESFLGGRPVFANYLIQLGPFVRPFFSMSIPIALAIHSAVAVWRSYRAERQSSSPPPVAQCA